MNAAPVCMCAHLHMQVHMFCILHMRTQNNSMISPSSTHQSKCIISYVLFYSIVNIFKASPAHYIPLQICILYLYFILNMTTFVFYIGSKPLPRYGFKPSPPNGCGSPLFGVHVNNFFSLISFVVT